MVKYLVWKEKIHDELGLKKGTDFFFLCHDLYSSCYNINDSFC